MRFEHPHVHAFVSGKVQLVATRRKGPESQRCFRLPVEAQFRGAWKHGTGICRQPLQIGVRLALEQGCNEDFLIVVGDEGCRSGKGETERQAHQSVAKRNSIAKRRRQGHYASPIR